MKCLLFFFLLLGLPFWAKAQELPFQKGVNLTNWLQAGSAREINYRRYSKTDFEQIKSLGCDVIRLPINLHYMTNGAPDYQLDPIFLEILDQAVSWAEELDLHLILDNHTFDPAENTDPDVGIILEKVWTQMAQHYKDQYENLYYEILNEPHGISHELWNNIQQSIVQTIRQIDISHTIIIGGADWNSYLALEEMPIYQDNNLIYTFHFYDPFLFTHQGATWVGPSMENLRNVPFPYTTSAMPGLPSDLRGTWVNDAYNGYSSEGNAERVKELIDIAIRFRDERQVPIFCGEFGVYQNNSQPEDRVRWYALVSDYLTEKNIAWTMWDYHGGFGVFESGSDGQFESDLNLELLEAVGFTQVTQSPPGSKIDSSGVLIYDDYAGADINALISTSGTLDFFDDSQPFADNYAIRWSDARQYDALSFDFQPNRNFSYLEASAYQLEFYAKSNQVGRSFDVRFVDSQTNTPGDKPWRNRFTITDAQLPKDGRWHHVQLPLKDFTEHGAWDGQWHNPIGAFDWSAIDRLEIVAEQEALSGTLQLDQIQLTSTVVQTVQLQDLNLTIFPNPTSDILNIHQSSPLTIHISILDTSGRILERLSTRASQTSIDLGKLPAGTYYLQLRTEKGEISMTSFIKH
ncbi:MAG TPA: cellulase family glycosylhydrolase [Saprospiraceae bacterium]|nr:cellulase family glycosylhydrolase [Saprospiraceae bacterium]